MQAPQTPVPQPTFVPVRPIRRSTSASESFSGSQTIMRSAPFRVSQIFLSAIDPPRVWFLERRTPEASGRAYRCTASGLAGAPCLSLSRLLSITTSGAADRAPLAAGAACCIPPPELETAVAAKVVARA